MEWLATPRLLFQEAAIEQTKLKKSSKSHLVGRLCFLFRLLSRTCSKKCDYLEKSPARNSHLFANLPGPGCFLHAGADHPISTSPTHGGHHAPDILVNVLLHRRRLVVDTFLHPKQAAHSGGQLFSCVRHHRPAQVSQLLILNSKKTDLRSPSLRSHLAASATSGSADPTPLGTRMDTSDLSVPATWAMSAPRPSSMLGGNWPPTLSAS